MRHILLIALLFSTSMVFAQKTKKITNNIKTTKILKVIKVREIIKHNNEKDCWIVIGKKVYDITNYIKKHPAPPAMLIKYCGKDGSKAFKSKDIGKDHNPQSYKLLEMMVVGKLKAK